MEYTFNMEKPSPFCPPHCTIYTSLWGRRTCVETCEHKDDISVDPRPIRFERSPQDIVEAEIVGRNKGNYYVKFKDNSVWQVSDTFIVRTPR
jgi:hypothetical protein